jgi:hypothetical protein
MRLSRCLLSRPPPWPTSCLPPRPPPFLLLLHCAELESKAQALSPSSLADLMWALGHLRYQPSEACCSALCRRSARLLVGMTADELGLVVWGMVQVGVEVPEAHGEALRRKAGVAEQGRG